MAHDQLQIPPLNAFQKFAVIEAFEVCGGPTPNSLTAMFDPDAVAFKAGIFDDGNWFDDKDPASLERQLLYYACVLYAKECCEMNKYEYYRESHSLFHHCRNFVYLLEKSDYPLHAGSA